MVDDHDDRGGRPIGEPSESSTSGKLTERMMLGVEEHGESVGVSVSGQSNELMLSGCREEIGLCIFQLNVGERR
jgi:hypothetical protein